MTGYRRSATPDLDNAGSARLPRFRLSAARQRWAQAICAMLVGAAGIAIFWPHPSLPKELRVGADNTLPYYAIAADGSVHGFAVDIFNEAARRRNIRLTWVSVLSMSPDQALAQGVVDVWPAVSHTPERDRVLHFSKPWLESDYCLLSRDSAPVTRQNADQARLAVPSSPRIGSLAKSLFPGSRRTIIRDSLSGVAGVCSGKTDAAFLDSRILAAVLLERPPGCGAVRLHVQSVPEATSPVSIASRTGVAATVDNLRAGISQLVADGTFAKAADRWSGLSATQIRSYFEMRETERNKRLSFYALLAVTVVALLLVWQVSNVRRAKIRAEKALRAAADSEARFQAFMDHSPMVGFMKDGQGRLLYANRRFTEIFEPTLGKFHRQERLRTLAGGSGSQNPHGTTCGLSRRTVPLKRWIRCLAPAADR